MADSSGKKANIVEILEETEDANKLSIKRGIHAIPSSRCCIYRAPKTLRIGNEDAYVPQIVSIGPFHRGKEKLEAMEEHKKWYLHAVLSRMSGPLDTSLECLFKAIRELEVHARECYPEPINLNSDEFVKMLLLDGCFILEYLYIDKSLYIDMDEVTENDNKPILNTIGMVDSLLHDLMLLENQIPFFVVERLFKLTRQPKKGGRSLPQLVISFLDSILPRIGGVRNKSSIRGEHLLDISRNSLLSAFDQQVEEGDRPVWEYRNSAIGLQKVGVNFKKRDEANGLLDITFSKQGVFEIPPFCLNRKIVNHFQNLIAFEQCYKNNKREISSYVVLLDNLINSERDLSLLCRKGIIENSFKDDEEAALVIHELCTGVIAKPFHYDGLCHRVNEYYGKEWNKWLAILKHEYYSSAKWKVLSSLFLKGKTALLIARKRNKLIKPKKDKAKEKKTPSTKWKVLSSFFWKGKTALLMARRRNKLIKPKKDKAKEENQEKKTPSTKWKVLSSFFFGKVKQLY